MIIPRASHRFAVVVSTVIASLALGQDNPLSPAAPVVLHVETFKDPQSNGIPSHTVLVPAGWKAEGGAWWPGQAYFNILPTQDIKVTAPDGRLVHIGPAFAASDVRPSALGAQYNMRRPADGAADQGNLVLTMPGNAKQWRAFLLQNAFLKNYPKAQKVKLDSVTTIPEMSQLLQKNLGPLRQQSAQSDAMATQAGVPQRTTCDVNVFAATCFYELDGKKWEHMIVFASGYISTESNLGQQIRWGMDPCVSYRAEAGHLKENLPLLVAIANSARPTPQWAQMKADHAAKMQQIAAKGAADRSAIIANTSREINKIITDGYNQRQKVQDQSYTNFTNALLDVEDYTTVGGGASVQLPNNYSYVYGNAAGEYILSNDASYNPNADPNLKAGGFEPLKPNRNQ